MNYDVFRQVKKQRLQQLEQSMQHEELEAAMRKPKIGFAMLGASNYPDSVMYYLTKLRFELERSDKYIGRRCPLCKNKIDRDHTIKCDYSNGIRTQRHDGVVLAIMKSLNKTRKAAAIKLQDDSKPDIDLEINNVKYCIDVNFSIANLYSYRYNLKVGKYQGAYKGPQFVIPVIIAYDGIIW